MDIASWFIREFNNLKATRTVKDRQRILSGSIVTAVVAGRYVEEAPPCAKHCFVLSLPLESSDTTRPTLIGIFYFLAKYPEHAKKIFDEVHDVDLRTTSTNTLATKPHLNAVIDESMRLLPAAMTGANRLTSEDGLWIDDTFIPPGVRVAAPKYSILRCESPTALSTLPGHMLIEL